MQCWVGEREQVAVAPEKVFSGVEVEEGVSGGSSSPSSVVIGSGDRRRPFARDAWMGQQRKQRRTIGELGHDLGPDLGPDPGRGFGVEQPGRSLAQPVCRMLCVWFRLLERVAVRKLKMKIGRRPRPSHLGGPSTPPCRCVRWVWIATSFVHHGSSGDRPCLCRGADGDVGGGRIRRAR